MSHSNVVAVGIDGACWSLINDWVESGALPNLKRLRERSKWGILESCIPPVTCPAWKCYSTGKNPGKLGIYWWENLDIENRESTIPNSTHFNSPEFWDILNRNGYSTGVVGMPLTYPPKDIDGFMISGGPGALDKGFASPSDLEHELKSKFGYSPTMADGGDIEQDTEEIVEKKIEKISMDFNIAKYLHDQYNVDFLQICSFEINGPIQHLLYDDDLTRKAWETIDRHLGELMEAFDYVVVHSDHGTSEMDKQFFVNYWLKQKGFLSESASLSERIADYGFHTDNIRKIIETLGMRNLFERSKLARRIARSIPNKEGQFGEAEGNAIFNKVEWADTAAVGLAQGPIYINSENMTVEEYEETRTQITGELESFEDPARDVNPIQDVFKREDIYEGEFVDEAPDLVALDAPRYHNKGGIGEDQVFADSYWRGNNARDGLYAISGPSVSTDRVDAQIYDLAPAILELFDVEVPTAMDGTSPLSH